jgi:hypothetical protein
MPSPSVISTNIPANEAYSGMVDLAGATVLGFELPETLTTTTLTFQAKARVAEDIQTDPGWEDWDDIYDDTGTELSVTVAGGRYVGLKSDKASVLSAVRYLRIRSGTSASPIDINPGALIRLIVK